MGFWEPIVLHETCICHSVGFMGMGMGMGWTLPPHAIPMCHPMHSIQTHRLVSEGMVLCGYTVPTPMAVLPQCILP